MGAPEGAPPVGAEPVGETSEAVTATYSAVMTDSSGYVKTQVKTCGWSAPASQPGASCQVDSGWVAVGGGANVDVNANIPSGIGLTESRPDTGKLIWRVASSDGNGAFPHRIQASVVQMQVISPSTGKPVPASTLMGYMKIATKTSSTAASYVTATAIPPADYNVIGGGGRSTAPTKHVYITAALKVNNGPTGTEPFGFFVAGTADGSGETANVTAYAIAMSIASIPGVGYLGGSSIWAEEVPAPSPSQTYFDLGQGVMSGSALSGAQWTSTCLTAAPPAAGVPCPSWVFGIQPEAPGVVYISSRVYPTSVYYDPGAGAFGIHLTPQP
jgi:hypothetical protein